MSHGYIWTKNKRHWEKPGQRADRAQGGPGPLRTNTKAIGVGTENVVSHSEHMGSRWRVFSDEGSPDVNSGGF